MFKEVSVNRKTVARRRNLIIAGFGVLLLVFFCFVYRLQGPKQNSTEYWIMDLLISTEKSLGERLEIMLIRGDRRGSIN